MYLIRGEKNGLTTIPMGYYWVMMALFTEIVSLELVRPLS